MIASFGRCDSAGCAATAPKPGFEARHGKVEGEVRKESQLTEIGGEHQSRVPFIGFRERGRAEAPPEPAAHDVRKAQQQQNQCGGNQQ